MFSRKQLTMKNHFSISPFLLYGFRINWQQPCLLIFASLFFFSLYLDLLPSYYYFLYNISWIQFF